MTSVWRLKRARLLLSAIILFAAISPVALRPLPVQAVTPDVTVSVDLNVSVGVSQFVLGMTHIDSSLIWADAGSMAAGQNVIAQSTSFQNTHLMAWGVKDPWPDPSQPGPTEWDDLDRRIELTLATGGTPIITLAEAPWWMKGQRQADGTTKLIPTADGDYDVYTYATPVTDFRGFNYPAGYVSPSPIAARVLDSQMNKWLLLVQRTAERYMAPPYNVRYFQVWNELKGYYNPGANRWDHTTSAGNTNGYNAYHGYTYMYNQVYQRLRQVATNLGIPLNQIKIGGPYVPLKTWADPRAGGYATTEPLLMNRPYGIYDQRDVDAIKYWLQNKTGAQFIVWDGGTKNREGLNLVNPYAASEKFWDTVKWLRSLNPATYPGADTLPIAYGEWYAFPYDTLDQHQHASVKTFAAMRYLQAGGWLALMWGGEERDNPHLNTSLYTETDPPGGGQGLAWADAARMLKDHFGPGTLLLATSQSGTNIGVLASPLKTMLVNKTNQTLVVAVNGVHVTLNPYRVMLIDTPPMIGPGPTPTPPPPVGDTTGPVVTITNPRNDSRVAVGTTITIRADVTDNVGVSVVNFFINDALVCSDTDLGYKCDWPVPPAKGAVYTIRVQAIDLADNRTNRTITVTGR